MLLAAEVMLLHAEVMLLHAEAVPLQGAKFPEKRRSHSPAPVWGLGMALPECIYQCD